MDRINRAHGGGGTKMRSLIKDIFLENFKSPELAKLNDYAAVTLPPGRVALTTDSFVVDPWEFPGGNIGDLAVCGTVNDLAMSGATPLYLTTGFILPEGFPLGDLRKIVKAMALRAEEAGVAIVAGDTKVVEAGCGPFLNTAGVGVIPEGVEIAGENARPGDAVIITGVAGSHGIAVLSKREGISFSTEILSDAAPLCGITRALLTGGALPHVLRDPTRGGVAEALNEIASQSGVEIEIDDNLIPLEAGVRSACDLLGYDPLHVANEGCMLVIIPGELKEKALGIIRGCRYGERAEIIGEVRAGTPRVVARTILGSRRLVDAPAGELLPRIC
ncbi:hydrogenase expression/formation protein HypE [bacterium]|nr:MAG: hydrogenase expression/formation protein HypE [bacterium]